MPEQILGLRAAHAEPLVVRITAAIGPAVAEPKTIEHAPQIRQRIIRIVNTCLPHRVIWPGGRHLEVIDLMSEAPQPLRNLHVHPSHASIGIRCERPDDYQTKRPHQRQLLLAYGRQTAAGSWAVGAPINLAPTAKSESQN